MEIAAEQKKNNTDSLPPSAPRRFSVWLPAVVIGVFWLTAFNQVRLEWTHNENYGYGWFVPFLGAYLIWERWQRRPAADQPRLRRFWGGLIILCTLFYFPWRLVREANWDWPLLGWPIGILAAVLTLYCVYAMGGMRWLRHFWFSIVFILVAVPWPFRIEHALTQSMMGMNASFAAEVLTICGIPALAHGNLVEVRDDIVDVDEACSGIRSMQTSIMMSLFLGEFYLLSFGWRFMLFFSGIALAVLTNLARTLTLAWLGSHGGAGLLDKWHDSIGLGILVFCVLSLWAIAAAVDKWRKKPAVAPLEPKPTPEQKQPFRVPPAFAWSILVIFALSEIGTEVWYRVRAPEAPDLPHWAVVPPENARDYRDIPISSQVEGLFNHSHAFSGTWASDRYRWSMYYFYWARGKNAVWATGTHRPEICLPSSGVTFNRFIGVEEIDVGGFKLPFLATLFDLAHGNQLHVFHLVWVENYGARHTAREFGARMRLQNTWAGDRNLDGEHQLLGIAVEGAYTLEEAKAALSEQLSTIVVPAKPETVIMQTSLNR